MENNALKSLFSSGTRIKILSLFFLNPGTAYYARQLEKILKTSVGQLRYELVNMEKSGLMLSSKAGNQKQYRINTEFVIYDELKSIFLKTASIGDVIKEKIAGIRGIELAFVYGSFAGSGSHQGSDIDIMVIGEPDEKDLHRAINAAEKQMNRSVNYSLYKREETQKRQKAGGNFIKTVFLGSKIIIKGSGSDELFGTGKQ